MLAYMSQFKHKDIFASYDSVPLFWILLCWVIDIQTA